ncbi:MAG: hypothetical protein HY423_04405 [Candidatus Lambdaproteobacteria bacterium]|nr:hypothetical protein [Candidatus Lambdaproteobacteria bacterium]
MATKTELGRQGKESAPDETRPGGKPVVLRDESDAIIDDLKRRLVTLEGQVTQRPARAAPPPGEANPPGGALLPGGALRPEGVLLPGAAARARRRAGSQAEEGLLPPLADRVLPPAEDLTARLERLIAQVGDPDLRKELERCRETAFYLFDTFRRISDRHALLTETAKTEPVEVAADFLADHLRCSAHGERLPVAVKVQPGLPPRLRLAARPLRAVTEALAQIAADVAGQAPAVSIVRAPGGKERGRGLLCLRVASASAWAGLAKQREVAALAMTPGLTAAGVVDLFYAAKIVQMQGGRLEFYRREGKVRGFAVWLPYGDAAGATPTGDGP